MSGVRSVKVADGLRHEYVTQNGSVVRDYVTTNASTGAFVRCLDFFYDQNGRPFAMRSYYDSTLSSYDTFHYVLNAQGDVVQLNYQGKQDKVYAQYTYDAWGNVLTKSGSLADVNPLRYRGYYCDTETGFYYLQSRYYDPAVRRFLNADSYGSTGQGFTGFNMFAYCGNNPVRRTDPTGHSWIDKIKERIRAAVEAVRQAEDKRKEEFLQAYESTFGKKYYNRNNDYLTVSIGKEERDTTTIKVIGWAVTGVSFVLSIAGCIATGGAAAPIAAGGFIASSAGVGVCIGTEIEENREIHDYYIVNACTVEWERHWLTNERRGTARGTREYWKINDDGSLTFMFAFPYKASAAEIGIYR